MKKIINFYLKAFLCISFISIPFIFIAFPDLNKNELTFKMWVSTFIPQLLYILYLFKKDQLFESFKVSFLKTSFEFNIAISFLLPFIIYLILFIFKLINIDLNYNWDNTILIYLIMIFLSALLEEILFRFIPFRILGNQITLKNIILISLFFSVFHLVNPNMTIIGFVNIIVAGVFFSILYLKSNSILLATIIHAFWNFTIGCILGSNISGMKITSILKYFPQKPFALSGGEFGFEGSIITTIILSVYSVFLYKSKTK